MASGGVPMVVREGADVAKTIRRQIFLLDALVLMQQRLEIAENKAAELKESMYIFLEKKEKSNKCKCIEQYYGDRVL